MVETELRNRVAYLKRALEGAQHAVQTQRERADRAEAKMKNQRDALASLQQAGLKLAEASTNNVRLQNDIYEYARLNLEAARLMENQQAQIQNGLDYSARLLMIIKHTAHMLETEESSPKKEAARLRALLAEVRPLPSKLRVSVALGFGATDGSTTVLGVYKNVADAHKAVVRYHSEGEVWADIEVQPMRTVPD